MIMSLGISKRVDHDPEFMINGERTMYFTDRGIEELSDRRGDESVTIEWLAERLRDFLDDNPEFETPIERFATWLARLDDEDD